MDMFIINIYWLISIRASHVAQWYTEMQESWVQSPGWEDSLEKGMSTHSSILAWRIPWTEEPDRLSKWDGRELDMTEQLSLHFLHHFKALVISHVQLFVTTWTVARWVPLSMEFSRQEYWSGLTFPSPGDHPNPGIKPWSPTLQADSLPFEL